MTSDEQLELLRSCVALRMQSRQVRESVRVGLASIEQTLIVHTGPLVRKTVAARLLGCSVQAIDRHVAKGRIPVEPIAEGSTRTAIPIRPLLDIAYEQASGHAHGLAASLHSLDERRQRMREFRELNDLITVGHRWARLVRERGTA